MFEDDKRVYGEITISTAEYMTLARKTLKYDLLRAKAKGSTYLTDFERAVFEIDENERGAENAVE